MTMADVTAPADLDIREKIAHIDQMLADIDRTFADRERIVADRDRKRQEIRLAPYQLILAGVAAAAGLLAAGGVIGGLLVRLYIG